MAIQKVRGKTELIIFREVKIMEKLKLLMKTGTKTTLHKLEYLRKGVNLWGIDGWMELGESSILLEVKL